MGLWASVIDQSPLAEVSLPDKVSVVIPAFNSAGFIREALESLLSQSYGNFEAVVIDDGSTDGTSDVVRELMLRDSRIRMYQQPNMGLGAARNLGIEMSHGSWIMFLDSDDCLVSSALKSCLDFAELTGANLVMFDTEPFLDQSFGERGSSQVLDHSRLYYRRREQIPASCLSGEEMLTSLVEDGGFRPSACLYIFRKSTMLDNQLRFEPGVIFEDNLFTPILFSCCDVIGYVREQPLHRRRLRPNSLSSGTSKELPKSFFIVASLLHKHGSAQKRHSQRMSSLFFRLATSNFRRAQRGFAALQVRDRGRVIVEICRHRGLGVAEKSKVLILIFGSFRFRKTPRERP